MSNKLIEAIKCPRKVLLAISRPLESKGFFDSWSDEKWIKWRFWLRMGKFPNLDNPQTFNEKLQWLKLNDRNPLYSTLVDKHAVKEYVADKIGVEYIIPTLGVWNNFDEIDFDRLPNQFVLKCTHDSGGVVVCKDKSKLDYTKAKNQLEDSLNTDYYLRTGREWPYKNVPRRIMAEQYMEDSSTKELRDYKFFAFDGKVQFMYIASERQVEGEETKFDFYDENFNHLPFMWGHPNSKKKIEKPVCFDKMIELAEELAEGFSHVRIDFYEVDRQIYFGEYTFYTYSGMTPFTPKEWDRRFGDYIKLPTASKK